MKFHYTDKYFMEPTHPITVLVVGCGGNGTQVLTDLAKINSSLLQLDHPGIHVTVMDADIIEEPNIGRQKFSEADLGQYKASVLTTRLNRFYGTNWRAVNKNFNKDNGEGFNIVISAVDNVSTRFEINKWFETRAGYDYYRNFYWLDFGNDKDFGQFILGSKKIDQPDSKFKTISKLKNVVELFPDMEKNEDITSPSCSTREALLKQDLFINSVLVSTGMNLIWKLLTEFRINTHGGYVNLGSYSTKPIKL